MLQTAEAEISVDGSVRLLEPLQVRKTSRVLVVLLDKENGVVRQRGNTADVLKFLRENRLPESARPTADEIEAQVMDVRESWE